MKYVLHIKYSLSIECLTNRVNLVLDSDVSYNDGVLRDVSNNQHLKLEQNSFKGLLSLGYL